MSNEYNPDSLEEAIWLEIRPMIPEEYFEGVQEGIAAAIEKYNNLPKNYDVYSFAIEDMRHVIAQQIEIEEEDVHYTDEQLVEMLKIVSRRASAEWGVNWDDLKEAHRIWLEEQASTEISQGNPK